MKLVSLMQTCLVSDVGNHRFRRASISPSPAFSVLTGDPHRLSLDNALSSHARKIHFQDMRTCEMCAKVHEFACACLALDKMESALPYGQDTEKRFVFSGFILFSEDFFWRLLFHLKSWLLVVSARPVLTTHRPLSWYPAGFDHPERGSTAFWGR